MVIVIINMRLRYYTICFS